jgi:hypothetical protein
MSDHSPVLRSRQAPAVATPPPAIGEEILSLELRKAHAIARAGDAIPKGYRGNDGAVLLALEWAQHHGMTLLQAMQSVSFVQGRPVVDATAQRALAERAGYLVVPTEITPSSCTVTVSRDGQVIGSASYSIEDATRAKLIEKDNWRTAPEDMLVARATGRAVRRYAPSVLFGLSTIDELDDPLERQPPEPAPPEPDEPVELGQVIEAAAAELEPDLADGPSDTPRTIEDVRDDLEAIDAAEHVPPPVATKIQTPTRGRLQQALELVDKHQLRQPLEAMAFDAGIDPAALTARRFKELSDEQAWQVIGFATDLVDA